ncbi:MAG: hypothetical protein E7390_08560, partial [Ruminococcaceae bacterium]|nr:hypothetical protein [Oscillospiraceae bacterium]
GCAPADAVRKTGNITDFFYLNPFSFFGNGSRTVTCALCHALHLLHLVGKFHSSNHPSK